MNRTPAAAYRKRWLRRRRNGFPSRVRPRPCPTIAGNCMSISTGPKHAAEIFRAYLRAADARGARVLLMSECSKFRGSDIAEEHAPGVWRVVQFGALNSAQSGPLLAVRVKDDQGRTIAHVGDVEYRALVAATSEGGGIRERGAAGAPVTQDPGTEWAWTKRNWATHAHPIRAEQAQARFFKVLRPLWGIKGGDMNRRARFLARVLDGSSIRAVHILAIALPRWIPATKAERIPRSELANADHDGAITTLWPSNSPASPKEK